MSWRSLRLSCIRVTRPIRCLCARLVTFCLVDGCETTFPSHRDSFIVCFRLCLLSQPLCLFFFIELLNAFFISCDILCNLFNRCERSHVWDFVVREFISKLSNKELISLLKEFLLPPELCELQLDKFLLELFLNLLSFLRDNEESFQSITVLRVFVLCFVYALDCFQLSDLLSPGRTFGLVRVKLHA